MLFDLQGRSQPSPYSRLAVAVGLALTGGAAALPTNAQSAGETRALPKISVQADVDDADIKVEKASSPKLTEPLRDTPQTITVVTQATLQQQGASTLIEALRNTPGITLQLGENGSTSAGDTFSLRGLSSQTNIFVDGIRDLGAVTRDTFNIDQIEIAKGAVGADNGRGAIAGYINLVSKLPRKEDSRHLSASWNTADDKRVTADLNAALNDATAVRFNAMWQDGEAVGRDRVNNNRWGVAPSVAFGLDTGTQVYLYSQHVRQDNVPDGGIPTIGLDGYYNTAFATGGANAGAQPARVDSENFYGHLSADGKSDDYEDMRADMVTLRVDHDFGAQAHLRNTARYGKSTLERVLTGINAITATSADPNQWTVARTRQSNFQDNKILTNQTNLTVSFRTGPVVHDLTGGIELIREQQYSPTYGGLGTLPAASLYKPDPYDGFTVPYAPSPTGAFSDGVTKTYAAYAFDTLKFGERWQLSTGLRFEHFDTGFDQIVLSTATTYPTLPVGTPVPIELDKSDNLLSWKLGAVYKPSPNGSLYASYANSLTPPGSSSFTLSNTATNINSPTLDPQEARNIELGTKWDLLDAQLALTAAVYRTENKNELVQLDATTNEYVQYGKRRVQGVELGATGHLTDNWDLIAGAAWSDNEMVQGGAGNNSTGAAARWSPPLTATLWSTFRLSKFVLGGGARYVDEQKRVVDPALNPSVNPIPVIPSYAVFDAMASYVFNDHFELQLNVYNLLDKFYIASLNNSGARLIAGAPRYAQLTGNFKF